jgi:hypothetical protein
MLCAMRFLLATSYDGLFPGLCMLAGIIVTAACLLIAVSSKCGFRFAMSVLIINSLMLFPALWVAYYLMQDFPEGRFAWRTMTICFLLATVLQFVAVTIAGIAIIKKRNKV